MQVLSDNYMQNVTPVTTNAIQNTPADGDDMTWREGYDNAPLAYAALVATVYRLQNEVHGLAAQVVELRERDNFFDGVLKRMSDTIQNMPNANRDNLLAQIAELREKVESWEGDS